MAEQQEGAGAVFALRSCLAEHGGAPVHVRRGEAWAADDPFVLANPDMFGPPDTLRRTGPPRVERATRAPGEVRGPGRRRASRDTP